MWEMW